MGIYQGCVESTSSKWAYTMTERRGNNLSIILVGLLGTLAMVDLYLGWVQEKISGTKDRMDHYQGRVEGIIPVTRLDAKTRINPITYLTRRDNPSYLG